MDVLNYVWEKLFVSVNNILGGIYTSLPNVIYALLVIVLGVLIGKMLKKAAQKILIQLGMKKATETTGFDSTLKKIGYKGTTVDLVSDLVKLFIYIATLAVAADILNLGFLVQFFQALTAFLPRLIIAIFILIIGSMFTDFISNFFKNMIREKADTKKEKTLASFSETVSLLSKIVLYLILFVFILATLNIPTIVFNITYALIGVSIITVVALGLKDIVPNYFSSIYLQKHIKEGDIIEVNDIRGKVKKVGALFTRLDDGSFVPNRFLTANVVKKNQDD